MALHLTGQCPCPLISLNAFYVTVLEGDSSYIVKVNVIFAFTHLIQINKKWNTQIRISKK